MVSRDHVFDKVLFCFLPRTLSSLTWCRLQLRVDVPPEPKSPPEVHAYAVGTPLNPLSPVQLPYPIKLVPRQRKDYFVPHQSFDVLQMFQNPMMLMMVFGGVMMLAMPYIMVEKKKSCQ